MSVPPEKMMSELLRKIEAAGRAGVDWVQIREKDLGERELAELAEEALRRVPESCRILINGRIDVALATGAGGAHLGENAMPAAEAKRLLRAREGKFLLGASVHSAGAAERAEKAGADYVIYGPVYATPSKAVYGEPQGLARLGDVGRRVSIPVIAIGGITLENAGACYESGAGGVAGIRIFQEAEDLAAVVCGLRG